MRKRRATVTRQRQKASHNPHGAPAAANTGRRPHAVSAFGAGYRETAGHEHSFVTLPLRFTYAEGPVRPLANAKPSRRTNGFFFEVDRVCKFWFFKESGHSWITVAERKLRKFNESRQSSPAERTKAPTHTCRTRSTFERMEDRKCRHM